MQLPKKITKMTEWLHVAPLQICMKVWMTYMASHLQWLKPDSRYSWVGCSGLPNVGVTHPGFNLIMEHEMFFSNHLTPLSYNITRLGDGDFPSCADFMVFLSGATLAVVFSAHQASLFLDTRNSPSHHSLTSWCFFFNQCKEGNFLSKKKKKRVRHRETRRKWKEYKISFFFLPSFLMLEASEMVSSEVVIITANKCLSAQVLTGQTALQKYLHSRMWPSCWPLIKHSGFPAVIIDHVGLMDRLCKCAPYLLYE